VTLNVYLFALSLREAMDSPRFHHQLLPANQLDVEWKSASAPPEFIEPLKLMGYKIAAREAIGDVQSILIKSDLEVEAESDSRGAGRALTKKQVMKRE
jgi:gamma-glutamyltranspeptidase/glutathione hydrolase